MFDFFRKKPAQEESEQGSGFPWAGAREFAACNFAFGDLMNNLPVVMNANGGVHCETFLAAAGAIAGFSAQRALFARGVPSGLFVATTDAGEKFYFGDPLNDALMANVAEEGQFKLFPLALGAALAGGVAERDLPPIEPMFAHVAKSVGEAGFFPSTPEARPHASTEALLAHVWPMARACFEGELSGKVLRGEGVVPQPWRPVIAAHAAQHCMRRTAQVLNPRTAAIVVMESAIYASKLDPDAIEAAG